MIPAGAAVLEARSRVVVEERDDLTRYTAKPAATRRTATPAARSLVRLPVIVVRDRGVTAATLARSLDAAMSRPGANSRPIRRHERREPALCHSRASGYCHGSSASLGIGVLLRLIGEPAPAQPSAYDQESTMSPSQLLNRWNGIVAEASTIWG